MRIALVASSYVPRPGRLERHVHELASGLARRGVEVEVLTQDSPRTLPPVSEFDGFIVRRFGGHRGRSPRGVAPGLWEHLRRSGRSFDLVDLHSTYPSLGMAVLRGRPREVVFTLHASVGRWLRWPYAPLTRTLIEQAAQIICLAAVERELLCGSFPGAADRTTVVPPGVDIAGITAARPFDTPGNVVLTIDRLESEKRIDRAIAALAALDGSFRLAVIGDGPARDKLLAYAADLQVSSRVQPMGHLPAAEVHRWLRTAAVVLALADDTSSPLHVTEAICAGAPVVASDIAVHREAAAYLGHSLVKLVSPYGSPLEIADRIAEAVQLPKSPGVRPPAWTWDDVVEETIALYEAAVHRATQIAISRV